MPNIYQIFHSRAAIYAKRLNLQKGRENYGPPNYAKAQIDYILINRKEVPVV